MNHNSTQTNAGASAQKQQWVTPKLEKIEVNVKLPVLLDPLGS